MSLASRFKHEVPTGLYCVCREGKDANEVLPHGDDLTLTQAVRLFVDTVATDTPVAIYAKMNKGAKRTHYVKHPPPVNRRNPVNPSAAKYIPPVVAMPAKASAPMPDDAIAIDNHRGLSRKARRRLSQGR